MSDAEKDTPGSPPPDETREVDRWMYQFTAQLAHDMRAPMGAIFMWAHVLRASDAGENRAAIEAIEASARQQSRMLADVVDMARALVGRLPVERTVVRLGDIVAAAVEEKAKDAVARRVALDWPGAGPGDTSLVKTDAKRLQQALGCLLQHGIANTPAGGRVAVQMSRDPGAALAEVRVRLPAAGAESASVDEMFIAYRASGLDLNSARPDFGMGLPFARAVARLHGGTLDVDNQGPGAALTFVLRLPVASAGK